MVKNIKGIKVLLNIGGPDKVKALMVGTKKKVQYDSNNTIHNFLISQYARKFRTGKNIENVFGLSGVDVENNEIIKKVKTRMRTYCDPLTFSTQQRRVKREINFKRKSIVLAEKIGWIVVERRVGRARMFFKTVNSSKKERRAFECFVNRGKLEVKYV